MKKIFTKNLILSLILLLGIGSSLNAGDGSRRRVETIVPRITGQEERINHLHAQLRERINDFDPAMERAHIDLEFELGYKFKREFNCDETLVLLLEYLRLNDLLRQLRVLDLSFNNLRELPANFGQGMGSLRLLKLSFNNLTELPANFGQEMGSLEGLCLNDNSLTVLPANFGQGMGSLKTLNLSYNELTELPEDFGQGMGSLEWLFLNNNSLNELPEDFGQGMRILKVLFLANNNLTVLPANFGQGMGSLKTLYLHHNNLTVLPENFGQGMESLERLLLNNNPLTQQVLQYLSGFVRDIRNTGRQFFIDIENQFPVPQINLEIEFPSHDLALQQLPAQMTIQELNARAIAHINITADQSCGICLQSIEELARADDGTEMAIIDGCHHIFCKECLPGWLTGHNTCPVCMQPVTGVKLVTLVG